MRGNVANKTKA